MKLFVRKLWHVILDRWSFRVVYKDGSQSIRLRHNEASDLCEMFCGREVIFDPLEEPI